ncbi:MAG: MmcQ/YjbR family DNA-binding protein [Elusimicrobia bacterium]|nr:MAG: MmcQ/YjbR family DNA-binding protein [Elusimicrobiota bacterium]
MTEDEYNAFCGSLPATTYVVQWDDAHVWKVGGKVFALARWRDGQPFITFKAGEVSYEVLNDQPCLRSAPYLFSRGLKRIQHHAAPGLSDEELRAYLRRAYEMVAGALSRRQRIELGLEPPQRSAARPAASRRATP